MHATDAIDRLAELAHDLWRDRMEQSGWSCATDFNPRTKHHDALVPFGELQPHDHQQAVLGVQAMDCLQQLADSIDYQRGPDRVFILGEMREGLRVVHNDPSEPSRARPTPNEPGHIIEWKSETGQLRSICVRWADGSTSEHHPAAGELRRLEDE
ncbi:MAG: RyR domain-containing protein [Planctomycetota bacterium]|nr:RyR domain-containing protein [Planctomycetota bacterium]